MHSLGVEIGKGPVPLADSEQPIYASKWKCVNTSACATQSVTAIRNPSLRLFGRNHDEGGSTAPSSNDDSSPIQIAKGRLTERCFCPHRSSMLSPHSWEARELAVSSVTSAGTRSESLSSKHRRDIGVLRMVHRHEVRGMRSED